MKRLRSFLVRSVQPPQLSSESAYLLEHKWTVSVDKDAKLLTRKDGQAATLSDMLSVMLRSTQSLGPEIRASAKRSLVIAFKTRLVNPLVPRCRETRGDLFHWSKFPTLCISVLLLSTRFLLMPELFPPLLFFPLAFLCFQLPLPVTLLSHHVPLFISDKTFIYFF